MNTRERCNRLAWAFMLFLALWLPALKFIYKYLVPYQSGNLHFPGLILMLFVYAFIFCSVRFHKLLGRWNDGPAIVLICFLLLVAMNYHLYPIADALKHTGGGTDQDDAIINGAQQLLAGQNPYTRLTYFGNPASPGPGWIALLTPFVSVNAYWLITPFCLLLAATALRLHTGDWRAASCFILIPCTTPAFFDHMVIGGDLFAFGCCLVMLVTLLKKTECQWHYLASGLIAGFLATSRIVFFYVPALLALFVWSRHRRGAMLFLASGILSLLSLHVIFYLWGPDIYAPLHLLGKGGRILSQPLKLFAVISSLATGILIIYRLKKNELMQAEDLYLMTWAALIVPLFWVALGDWITVRNYNFASWEGAGYLLPPLPLLAAAAAITLADLTRTAGDSNAEPDSATL